MALSTQLKIKWGIIKLAAKIAALLFSLSITVVTAQETIQKNPADVQVPEGYTLQVAASGLSFASDITFGANGEIYVSETGYPSCGLTPEEAPPARILQIMPDGSTRVVYNQNVSFEDVTLTGKDLVRGIPI